MGFSKKDDLQDLSQEPGREKIKKEIELYVNKYMVFQKKVKVTLADFVALGAVTTAQLKVFELPEDVEVLSAFIKTTDPLVGPGPLTAATGSLGADGVSWISLITAGSIFAAGIVAGKGADLTTNGSIYGAAKDLKAEFVNTGCDFADLTAGEVEITIDYIEHAGYVEDPLP